MKTSASVNSIKYYYNNLFRYTCSDPARKLTNLVNTSLPQLSTLAVTCLTNGQYDINIKDFTCLSKLDLKTVLCNNKIISLDHG